MSRDFGPLCVTDAASYDRIEVIVMTVQSQAAPLSTVGRRVDHGFDRQLAVCPACGSDQLEPVVERGSSEPNSLCDTCTGSRRPSASAVPNANAAKPSTAPTKPGLSAARALSSQGTPPNRGSAPGLCPNRRQDAVAKSPATRRYGTVEGRWSGARVLGRREGKFSGSSGAILSGVPVVR
jgi:hypothetical protein